MNAQTMKTVKCTQRALDRVLATIHETGYAFLDRHEKEVANAYDAGTLSIQEPVSSTYSDMVRANGEVPAYSTYHVANASPLTA